jgi:hypothetical protein
LGIFFFILYYTVRAAIDDSEMAKNIRGIRRLLDKDYNELSDSASEEPNDELDLEDNFQLLDIAYDECPACKGKVSLNDRQCPHCGLTFNQDK